MTPEQEQLLKDVHSAIVGNEALGQEGLVKRILKLERYKNTVVLVVLVGTPVCAVVWAWIQKKYLGL